MRTTILAVVFVVTISVPGAAAAQQSTPFKNFPAVKARPVQKQEKLFNDSDVVKMVKAGLSDTTIIEAIQRHPVPDFDLSPNNLSDLKQEGVSAKVLNARFPDRC